MKDAKNFMEGSDAFKCKKCSETKCQITMAQTSSADEPMTNFISFYCGHKYKFC
jgi:DNA-directed RNA polymerase subunit M/transcription elongation factor TFIIS